MAAKNSVNSPFFCFGSITVVVLWIFTGALLIQGCSASAEVIVVNEDPKTLVPTSDSPGSKEASIPREDGILRIGSPYQLKSFDPLFAMNPTEFRVVSLLYDRLFRLDQNGSPVPYLVDRWQRSEDQLTYTFTLRNDVFYHDADIFSNGKGRRILAEDIKSMIARVTDPNVPSLGRELLHSVKGLPEMTRERFEVKNTTLHRRSLENSVRVVNASTIQITLEKPDSRFLHKLASPVLSVYPSEALRTSQAYLHSKPVGSGPYELSRHQDSLLVLVRTSSQRADFVNGSSESRSTEMIPIEENRKLSYTGWNRIDIQWIEDDRVAVERLRDEFVDWLPDAGPYLAQTPDVESMQPLSVTERPITPVPIIDRFHSFVITVYTPVQPFKDYLDSPVSLTPVKITTSLPEEMLSYCTVELTDGDILTDTVYISGFSSPYVKLWFYYLLGESNGSAEQLVFEENGSDDVNTPLILAFRDGYHTQLTSSSIRKESDPSLWNKIAIAELRCIQPALLRKGAAMSTAGLENSPVPWRIPDRLPS